MAKKNAAQAPAATPAATPVAIPAPAMTAEQIATLMQQNAGLMASVVQMLQNQSSNQQRISITQMSVGIRNISSQTIGIGNSPTPNEGDVQLDAALAPTYEGGFAVVSYAWWRQIRQGKLYQRGLIVRDDSVLGPIDQAAPEDSPQDLAQGAAVNQVHNPHTWITSRSDAELRADIQAMTSEASIRRLQAAVDSKVQDIRVAIGADGIDPEKEKEAIMSLPGSYAQVERICDDRLQILMQKTV